MLTNKNKSDGRYDRLTEATILPRRLFLVPLIAAALLGVKQPAAYAEFDPPGPDVFCADNAATDFMCQVSAMFVNDALQLPEVGGQFQFISNGQFVMGTDGARLTGDITGGGNEFSVAIDFTGPNPADPGTVEFLLRSECFVDHNATIASWIQFAEISGELVGLPGSLFADTRYAITKRSTSAQFGEGANTHNLLPGLFAKINFELVENPHNVPGLPVGPFAGDVSVSVEPGVLYYAEPPVFPACFPPTEPDLAGTWTGTIDCVGFDAESAFGATPVERFFSAAELKIGRSDSLLDVGYQYSVRLTRQAGNAQSFCAYAPNNPGSTTGGQGVLVEPQRQSTRVHFRFEGETLKARELIADGLHGTQLCKWNLTRTSTTPPTVTDACSPVRCYTGSPSNQCDDNALCGQAGSCGFSEYGCTCEDGYVGGGDVWSGGCTPAP